MAREKKVHLIDHPGTYKDVRRWGKRLASVCGKDLPTEQIKADRYSATKESLVAKTTCLSCLKQQRKRDQDFIDMMIRIADGRVTQRLMIERRMEELRV